MTIWETILLGVVQGLTEFLPVSSSGHLVLVQVLLDVEEAGVFFDVVLHLGTLGSIGVVYRRDLLRMASAAVRLVGQAHGPQVRQGHDLVLVVRTAARGESRVRLPPRARNGLVRDPDTRSRAEEVHETRRSLRETPSVSYAARA